MKAALLYLLAITAAEVVTVSFHPVLGILGHSLILASLILHSVLTGQSVSRQLYLSLVLVPLIRIISLSMPLAGVPLVWWYPIIYTPLLVAALRVVRILGYSLGEIGFQVKRLLPQVAIALTGVVFGIAEYFILSGEAEATGLILRETLLLSAFLLLVTTGFVEEVIFRGVLQRSAIKALGWMGVVYSSLIFAVVHWIHSSVVDILFVFVVALFFAWAVKKTGSLLGVTLAHGIANIVLFLIAPLLF